MNEFQERQKRKLKESTVITHDQFTYQESSKSYKCNHCSIHISSQHTGNMKSHLARAHEEVHKDILIAESVENKNKKPKTSTGESDKPVKIVLSLSPQQVRDACVELCTINGRPLCSVEDSGFKKILDPICEALNITVNRHNVRDLIRQRADAVRKEIADILSECIYYLKADSATRLQRSIFGLNCQVYWKGRIRILTLAMTEVRCSSTGENIKNYVIQSLKRYNASLKHCKGFTKDNGSNYIKTGKILEVLQCLGDEDEGIDYQTIEYIHKKAYIDEILSAESWFLENIQCWPHTSQLAVKSFLNEKDVNELLLQLDVVAKALRTPTMHLVIEERNANQCQHRNETRWSSTFDQCQSLVNLRPICDSLSSLDPDLYLSPQQWKLTNDLLDTLRPVRDLTVKLQAESLTASDAFVYMKSCLAALKGINTTWSLKLHDLLSIRANGLLAQPGVLTAVLFDPRYSCLLNEEEKNTAIRHAMKVNKYLDEELNYYKRQSGAETQTVGDNPVLSSNTDPKDISNDTSNSSLDDFLSQLLDNSKDSSIEESQERFDLEVSLKKLLRASEPKDVNIFEFWERIKKNPKHEFYKLYDLAVISLSLPVSQVSVERCFSGLKFILNYLRSNADLDLLEDILIIFLNKPEIFL